VITIIDYGMGNPGSIANMLKKLGAASVTTADPAAIARAERLILPGVGAFDVGMANLHQRGLVAALEQRVLRDGAPLLGICLGMQLLTRSSDEGRSPGLGWIHAETVRFRFPTEAGLRVPHMGWNAAAFTGAQPLARRLAADSWRFYFVHSYFVTCRDPADALCTTTYGQPFTSGVGRGGITGVQFHPEKSHRYGMRLLQAWLDG